MIVLLVLDNKLSISNSIFSKIILFNFGLKSIKLSKLVFFKIIFFDIDFQLFARINEISLISFGILIYADPELT